MPCHLARLRGLRYCGIPDCDICGSPERREDCDCGAKLEWWTDESRTGAIVSRCPRCERAASRNIFRNNLP